MIRGIGIDTVYIPDIRRFLDRGAISSSFFARTFTDAERKAAGDEENQAEYYAARFATKEAVFKALAHLLRDKSFDLRIIETLHHADGAPYINCSGALQPFLNEAGIETIHLSVTTEKDYASAFVVAES